MTAGGVAVGPLMVKTFTPEVAAYWTSVERMGEGRWEGVLSADKGKLTLNLAPPVRPNRPS